MALHLPRPTQWVVTLAQSRTQAGTDGVNISFHMYTQEWGDFRIHFCAISENADNKYDSFDSDHIPYLFTIRQEVFNLFIWFKNRMLFYIIKIKK